MADEGAEGLEEAEAAGDEAREAEGEESEKAEESAEEEEEPKRKASKHVTIVLEEDSSKFRPQFYTFRRSDERNVARGPPFWVLTDHLIAVIWHLFKDPPSEEPIGISQLQWSLEFLRNVRDDTGEYPEYVLAAIQGLEDRLLELYASVPTFFEEEEPEEEKPAEEGEGGEGGEGEEQEEEGEEEEYEEVEEEGYEGEEGEEVKPRMKKVKKKRRSKKGSKSDSGKSDDEEGEAEEEEEFRPSLVVNADAVDRPSQSMLKRMSMRQSQVKEPVKELDSSVTIKDVLSKSPKKPPKDPELESLVLAQKCSCGSVSGKSPTTSSTKVGSGTKVDGAAKNDMMRFLNSLRKEQTDRISIELKQLEKINDFLREVESGRCSPATMKEIREKKHAK